jgi:5-methylcytosine-specific restriction endonuclease McrA
MSSDWYEVVSDKKHIAKERQKAKDLRKTPWWKQKISLGVCHYCEKKFSPDELTMDHVVPIARGGRSTKANIVVACQSCNAAKKLKTPAESLIEKLQSLKKADNG